MQVNFSTYTFNNSYTKNSNPSFMSASDLTLNYILKNHSKYLPERILVKIKTLCETGEKNLPAFYELHDQTYKLLMEAETLEKVKQLYPEFKDVIDITKFSDNRSKAIKAIKEKMPLEDFTLEYLKDVYKPLKQEEIVKKYGFTNRSLAVWLNEKLNIMKLSSPYLNLLMMTNEAENSRIAELSRRAIYANAEAQKYRLEKAAEAHRTPEYRTKKREEMIDYYNRNPELREKVRETSQKTWDNCTEIKQAMSDFTKEQPDFIRAAIRKQKQHKSLLPQERRAVQAFYKAFWNKYSYLKDLYGKIRKEISKEIYKK